ncbi:MAG TPA: SCO family protein [Flavisolibacter sp.]|jgi:protein SCO1/2|nr:SCO family protein [Flavisolibacter sp.]
MNNKALYGILMAVILPLTGYFLLKRASDKAVVLPKHYIFDSVSTTTKNGKAYTDTIWHKLPDITMTNQLGQHVSWNDLKDKIIVADFFFTRCPTICPYTTANMKKLQDAVKNNETIGNREPDFIQFLSFTIDPARDSVRQLKNWSDRFQINPNNWWLLTGKKQDIYNLSINDMKLMAQDGGPEDSNFLHTDFFVLIDKNRNIRGYYHGLDSIQLSQLSRDLIFLYLEKDPHKKFFLHGKLEFIAIVFFIVFIGLLLLFTFLKKENRQK